MTKTDDDILFSKQCVIKGRNKLCVIEGINELQGYLKELLFHIEQDRVVNVWEVHLSQLVNNINDEIHEFNRIKGLKDDKD